MKYCNEVYPWLKENGHLNLDIVCCFSCHEDSAEYGYDLVNENIKGLGEVSICCSLSLAIPNSLLEE